MARQTATACSWPLRSGIQQRERIVRTMREHRVDGVILCSTPFSTEQSKQLRSDDIPIVVINNQSAEDYRYSIYHDDLDGSRQVIRHLIELGHRRIAYLGYATLGAHQLKRLTGYRGEMAASRVADPGWLPGVCPASDPQVGRLPPGSILAPLPDPPPLSFATTICSPSAFCTACKTAGLRVPQDCSVAGFDNITFSALHHPASDHLRPAQAHHRRAGSPPGARIAEQVMENARPENPDLERQPARAWFDRPAAR